MVYRGQHPTPGGRRAPPARLAGRGDGPCGTRGFVALCARRGVEPVFRIPISTTGRATGSRGSRSRVFPRLAAEQFGGGARRIDGIGRDERLANQREWKSRKRYHRREAGETAFSTFKRRTGDHVSSRRWDNVVREVIIRVHAYNELIDIAERVRRRGSGGRARRGRRRAAPGTGGRAGRRTGVTAA